MEALMAWLRRPLTVRIARIGIGVILLAAGLAKLGDLKAFATQIHNFRLTPIFAENLVAMGLPWIEIFAGVALLLGIRARGAAILAAAMMIFFTLAVGQAWMRGLDIECGCFGTADASRVGLGKLLQNTGMTLLALVASLDPR